MAGKKLGVTIFVSELLGVKFLENFGAFANISQTNEPILTNN
jgi:hypothetical protein